ncbi:MAG: hypothetical protein D6804_08295, partial [Aquificota bacterium]
MEKVEERVDRLERLMEYLIEEMADFKKWVIRYTAETDRKIEEYREEHRKELRELNKRWGEIANKMGTIVEDIVFPAFKPVVRKYFQCEPERAYLRVVYENRKKGIYEEFDAFAVCEKQVFLLEVKTTPREKHIEEFKEKAKRFLQYFPEYADKELILIMGSLSFSEGFIRLLSQAGIYAMAFRE